MLGLLVMAIGFMCGCTVLFVILNYILCMINTANQFETTHVCFLTLQQSLSSIKTFLCEYNMEIFLHSAPSLIRLLLVVNTLMIERSPVVQFSIILTAQ